MKKLPKFILISILVILTVAIALQYFGVKYGNFPSSRVKASINAKERKEMAQRFGISVGNSLPQLKDEELDETLDDISKIGFTWIRFDIDWELVQPVKNGFYRWDAIDRIVKAANKHKLRILPILTYAPEWVGKTPNQRNYMLPLLNRVKFANFAEAAAKRYSSQNIHAWEIWNEPNLEGFWRPAPSPRDYADLLKRSFTNIKKVDPNAIIVSGGLAAIPYNRQSDISGLNFLEGIYDNDAKDYFDVFAYHPFSFPQLPSAMIARGGWSQLERPFFRSVRSVMAENGDKKKPIWATEFGVATKGINQVSESLQVKMLEDVVQQMKSKPWIKALFWYSYKDLSSHTVPAEKYFGLVRVDGTRKPAYFTFKSYLNTN